MSSGILRYKNEILLAVALLFALSAFTYKYVHRSNIQQERQEIRHSLTTFQKAIALKNRWGDRNIGQKIESLHRLFPASKVVWKKRSKKLNATFHNLSGRETNKLLSKLFNVAVQITKLHIESEAKNYRVDIACKW